jgi:TrmH family RNA methyltransferase
MRKIDGQKDPVIKLLRALHNETGRVKHSCFVVEGPELVRRAMDFAAEIECLVVVDAFARTPEGTHLLDKAAGLAVDVCVSSAGLLAKALAAKPTPNCVAVARRQLASLDTVLSGTSPLVVMVEHGENADNLGMLLRSAEAAGVTGVILAADTTDPFSRRAVRGSRGAVMLLPICIVADTGAVLEKAKETGLGIVSSSASSNHDYGNVDYSAGTVIIVGNEHVGISDAVRRASDHVVRIPMLGRLNSLNIAVAAGILLYEAVRQRRGGNHG